MTNLTVYSMEKKKVGQIDVVDAVFDQKPRLPLVFESVQAHLVNMRQGNASTKTRSCVRGGGKKPYKQKGTGNARHGSIRSPLFVGGGTAFGPHPRQFEYRLPKAARRAALCSALSIKQREGKVLVVDTWQWAQPKTKLAAATLRALGVHSGLVVLVAPNAHVQRALRNVPNIKVIPEALLNAYDVLRFEHVVFTQAAVQKLMQRVGA